MPTVAELKESLRARGLKLVGDKAELEARIARANAGRLLNSNKKKGVSPKKPSSVENLARKMAKMHMNAPKPAAKPVPAAPAQGNAPQFGKMKVAELKEYLKRGGRRVAGTREELERRARNHFAGRSSPPKAPAAKKVYISEKGSKTDRAAFEKTKATLAGMMAEYSKLPPWTARNAGMTIEHLRSRGTPAEHKKFELLRGAAIELGNLDEDDKNAAFAAEKLAFLKAAGKQLDALIAGAPKGIRFYIES
jgi:hypothetical protein